MKRRSVPLAAIAGNTLPRTGEPRASSRHLIVEHGGNRRPFPADTRLAGQSHLRNVKATVLRFDPFRN